MQKGSRKRFNKLLPNVLITDKQQEGVLAQTEAHAMTISDVVRAALNFYLEAHPLKEDRELEKSE